MDRKKLESILNGFSKVKLLVVGDIMMDRSISGRVSRISPEAPVPVVVVEKEDFNLGGAANVANNIRSLGGKVSLCGVLGVTRTGRRYFKDLLKREFRRREYFLSKDDKPL